MKAGKRKSAKTAADANRIIRAGVRRILTERADEWRPLWVRQDDAGVWRVERVYGGAPELVVDVQALPVEVRHVVNELLDLLGEQAWCARLAGILAQAEVGTDARRETGASKGRAAAEKDARERDEKLRRAIVQIRKDDPHIMDKDLAAVLSDKGYGGQEAIRKKIPRLDPRKKSRDSR